MTLPEGCLAFRKAFLFFFSELKKSINLTQRFHLPDMWSRAPPLHAQIKFRSCTVQFDPAQKIKSLLFDYFEIYFMTKRKKCMNYAEAKKGDKAVCTKEEEQAKE